MKNIFLPEYWKKACKRNKFCIQVNVLIVFNYDKNYPVDALRLSYKWVLKNA